jgi:hypothetical protein
LAQKEKLLDKMEAEVERKERFQRAKRDEMKERRLKLSRL